jgi:hypothetical protein
MQSVLRLRRFLDAPQPAKQKARRCELCGAVLSDDHAHVTDLEERRLLCACRPCYLLFTHPGAAGGRFRAVPDRVVKLPGLAASGRLESLDIPVGIAFLLRNSRRNRMMALYPSPAGAMESGLALETWEAITAACPELGTMEADVESLLICRRRERTECWIVPIDRCYELAGRLRRHWRGFDGGTEAWIEVDEFLAGLEQRERSCV